MVLHTHKVKSMDMQDFLFSCILLAFFWLQQLGMREQGLFSLGFGCNLLASAELGGGVPSFAWMHRSQAGGSFHSSVLPTFETAPAAPGRASLPLFSLVTTFYFLTTCILCGFLRVWTAIASEKD